MGTRDRPLMNLRQNARDPERSRDPRVRELVVALHTLTPIPAPRAQFRAELRAQLVAITPATVADAPAPSAGRRLADRLPRLHLRRPLAVLASMVVVLALLLGGAFVLSQRALPGDALYGFKRATERLHEAVTGGNTDKATLLLSYAATRYDEVGKLIPKNGALGSGVQADSAEISPDTASLIASTLGSADDDVRNGMRTIGAQVIEEHSGSIMQAVIDWYPTPRKDLRAIVDRIPETSPAHQSAVKSLDLLEKAGARAAALVALQDCSCLSNANQDYLGAVPCTICAQPPTGTPSGSTASPSPSTSPSTSVASSSESASTSATAATSASGATGSASATPAQPDPGGATSSADAGGGTPSGGETVPPPTTDPPSSVELPPVPIPSIPVPSVPDTSSIPIDPTQSQDPPTSDPPTQPVASTSAADPLASCTDVVSIDPVSVTTCGIVLGP